MNEAILKTENLKVRAGDREILHNINLSIGPGETHVIMGPNGAGKSTLVSLIMGDPAYSVTEGKVLFRGEDITELPVNERAAKGLFMSFQNPIEVPGISLFNFIRTALEMRGGEKIKIWEYRKEVTERTSDGSRICRKRPERGFFRRRKEKGGSASDASFKAFSCHSG